MLRSRLIRIAFAAALAVVAMPMIAAAHNLGHLSLPDGTCMEIGSGKEAPLVGPDHTQLDLIPRTPNPPFDEYGVSFVGASGNTPIRPGRCPVAPLASAQDSVGYAGADTLIAVGTM
jgi:hypothetical protein